LECALHAAAAKDRKNQQKSPHFESSGSFKVNDVDTTEKLVSCDRQHAHAYLQPFHERQGNNGKITTFMGVSHLVP